MQDKSKTGLYSGLSLFFMEVLVMLELMKDIAGFLKHFKFLVETSRQSCFPEETPLSLTIGNTINFRFFWKNNPKKNKQWF